MTPDLGPGGIIKIMKEQPPTQNKDVARYMQRFFRDYLREADAQNPGKVALKYADYLSAGDGHNIITRECTTESRFYVGLGIDSADLDWITKRGALVSDTLMLTHSRGTPTQARPSEPGGHYSYSFNCPSLPALGKWILDAAPLLEAGIAWYLPRYSNVNASESGIRSGLVDSWFPQVAWAQSMWEIPKDVDYLIHDGRAIDTSGGHPVIGRLVRPILEVDLPFIDGVDLREFSKITIGEFDSYDAFRDFLRGRLLAAEQGVNAVAADVELAKIGLEIKDGIRSMAARMAQARRSRAVGATGAVVGTVGAILVAVYGQTLAEAVAIAGASGGIWQIIQAAAENSPRVLHDDKWYYVWVLSGAKRPGAR